MHICYQLWNPNVETSDLFGNALLLKVLIHGHMAGRLCPWAITDILAAVAKEIKISKECIPNNIIPCQVRLAGNHCVSCGVVVVQHCLNHLQPCLESLCYVFV